MHSLEKDFREVERNSKTALSLGKKSKLLIENKENIINELKKKAADLSAQIINLTSENKRLQMNENEKKPVEQPYVKEILKEWRKSLDEMKTRTESYEKESETLHQALQIALDCQTKLQNLEAAASGKVRELEAKLKVDRERSCTDCCVQTELTVAIEVGCQTTTVKVINAATQSDYVELQMKDKDNSLLKTLNSSGSQDTWNLSAYTSSSSTFKPTIKYSVSKMISTIQKKRAEQESEEATIQSQPQDFSELPTQVNMQLDDNNKN